MSSSLSYAQSWIRPWQKPRQPLPGAENEDKIITGKGWRQHHKKGKKALQLP
jgi:hypothetical protein